MFTEDLAVFFADFGDDATFGLVSGRVIYDRDTQLVLTGQVLDDEESALMASATFPALANGDALAITGRGSFTVREVRAIDDGALKRVTLRRA